MKIQLQDEQGNMIEHTTIDLGENELLLVKIKMEMDTEILSRIGNQFQEAVKNGGVLVCPEWVELIVVKETT